MPTNVPNIKVVVNKLITVLQKEDTASDKPKETTTKDNNKDQTTKQGS